MEFVTFRGSGFNQSCIFCLNLGSISSDYSLCADLYAPLSPKVKWYFQGNGEPWKQKEEDGAPFNLITIVRQDHFR